MTQLAKTVYFSDYPRATVGRSGLTIPFPESQGKEFASIVHLSSYTIRELIGYDSFAQLEADARLEQSSTASFARDLLIKRARVSGNGSRLDYRVALQATFQGGRGSPLHDWYPYLEGYSPDFVNSVIDTFCPHATSILDPFCGSGTTALISSLRGIEGFYSEVNPVCRFITEAKLTAVQLSIADRTRIANELEDLAKSLGARIKTARASAELSISFKSAFGDSRFFDEGTFHKVLRLRSLLDDIQKSDVTLGKFVQTAMLRSLIPSSLLIRRGDLRFKTPEELRRAPPDLMDEVKRSLKLIASDLHDAPLGISNSKLVCTDARLLANHAPKKVDAIITSPPYLNGTNYFRNTKVELWFMRELDSRLGLRNLRDAAITSGINDVTAKKTNGSKTNVGSRALSKVMAAFKGNAYDVRIPMMVRSYFGEMSEVVDNFDRVLAPEGTIAIDLGDSCYGSVWVPTDKILKDLLEQRGFKLADRVVLRERQSRDGRKLNQTLQIFRRAGAKPKPARELSKGKKSTPPTQWQEFKVNLSHQKGEMAKRNWGHPLHSLCSYQGKLKPSLAHNLVRSLLSGTNKRLLDPFAGVGTIPFEAQLLGHVGFGFDISPAALAISRAKLEPIETDRVDDLLRTLRKAVSSATITDFDLEPLGKIRFNGPLPLYFHQQTLAEILAVRRYFIKTPPKDGSSSLVFSAMLHILHGNRPYALSRRSHPITPFAPTGPTEYRPLIERLTDKVERSLAAITSDLSRRGRAYHQDATKRWPDEVNELDAIITSPPFFDSTRFHTANWMRLWFSGWEAHDFQQKPASFVDERQKISFDVYRPIFEQSASRLKRGGLMLIHVGKSAKCDMAKALCDLAAEYLSPIDVYNESVEHCESHGIRDKGTVTHHQYILLRRAT